MTAVHVVCHALVLTDACGQRHIVFLARQWLVQHHVCLIQFHKLIMQLWIFGILVWVNLQHKDSRLSICVYIYIYISVCVCMCMYVCIYIVYISVCV